MTTAVVKRLEDFPFDVPLEICKAAEGTGEDKGRWIVEGFAATTDLDLQNEEIEQGAIDGAAKDLLKNSTVLLNHDENRPIAKVVESQSKPGGLFVKTEISKSEPDIWTKVKEGILNKFSIRGRILDAVQKWNEQLGRMVKVIRKMVLVETSLVSVPANPNARTLRWYVSKSLEEFAKSGGFLPTEGAVPEGEEGMSGTNEKQTSAPAAPTAPTAAATQPAGGEPPSAVMEVKLALDEAEKKKVSQVMFLVDRLLAGEKDEKRRATLMEIKALATRMAGGAYPYPSPYSYPGAGAQMACPPPQGRKELPEHIAASYAGAVAPHEKRAHFDAIAALAGELVKGETDADRRKALEELRAEAAIPAPSAAAQLSSIEQSAPDAAVKAAVGVARALVEETSKSGGGGKVERLMKLHDGLESAIKEVGGAAEIEMAHHAPVKPMDGKCPEGYELKDNMCMWVGPAKAKSEGGAAPAPTTTPTSAAPPAMTPEAIADAVVKAFEKSMAPVLERIAKVEKTAGVKKSLDGQEDLPEGGKDASGLGEVFRRVTGGALQRAGYSVGPKGA